MRIVRTTAKVRIKVDLGNGFRRSIMRNIVLAPISVQSISIQAPQGHRVITGGWRLIGAFTAFVIATETFPISDTEWRITIFNRTQATRTITPYLISKSLDGS